MADQIETRALLKLMSWMSPAFPVGAFAYSHGLERAVHDGWVTNKEELVDWLSDILTAGSAWNDAVLFVQASQADPSELADLADLAEAMAGASERHLETMRQGSAFIEAARAWPHRVVDTLPSECPMPVAAGSLSGAHKVPVEAAVSAYLHAFLSNLVQASLRLMALSQQDGAEIIAELEPQIASTAARAAKSTLDDLGGMTFRAEIAALNHESQPSRLFRS